MRADLLLLIGAERQADKLVQDALSRKKNAIAQAMDAQRTAIKNIKTPIIRDPTVRRSTPDFNAIKRRASRNRKRTIRLILEAMHDAA